MVRPATPQTERAQDAGNAPSCATCARTLPLRPGPGRPARFCSAACRQAAHRRRQHGEKTRDLVTLIEGDARRLLASLPGQSVDLVVTDPPYRFERGNLFQRWFADLPDDAWAEVLAQLYRVLRPDRHAYLFCDQRTRAIFEQAAEGAGFRLAAALIWNKNRLGLGGGAYRSQYEYILLLEKGRRPPNRRDLGNVLTARPPRGYPTEKPLPVLRTLIDQSSNHGELVLDPFCGSGNTGHAARELGRQALLYDIDTAFAARRLRNAPVPPEPAAT